LTASRNTSKIEEVTLEKTLYYITHHSEAIIQWLFLTILLLAGTLIARSLFGKKETSASAAAAGQDIESFLQKILEQTGKLERVPVEKMSPEQAALAETQVQQLKKDLQSREQELVQLKASGSAQPSVDADKLGQRIKELESKLAEYEILEDDIADLSLYKEENARLRVELDKIKSGGNAEAAASSTTASEPMVPPIPVGEDIVAEFAQAVSQESIASLAGSLETQVSGDPMADFAAAMTMEEKPSAPPAPEFPLAPPAPPAQPSSPPKLTLVPNKTNESGESDDLFAEFASAELHPEEELDTDKMMAEMASLVSIEGSATPSASGLEETIDTEKMALEATKLTKS
jgi:hypothetical protein